MTDRDFAYRQGAEEERLRIIGLIKARRIRLAEPGNAKPAIEHNRLLSNLLADIEGR